MLSISKADIFVGPFVTESLKSYANEENAEKQIFPYRACAK